MSGAAREQRELAGWGRLHTATSHVIEPVSSAGLASVSLPPRDVIARGLGRSYGDPAQRSGGTVVDTSACRGVHWIDRDAGLIRADAGTTIDDLISVGVPCGWFVPVTPGTRNVTVGGAIAADIHGKNHHVDGSFGNHVRRVRLRLADDSIVVVSPGEDPALFWATVGGMGLTGIVLDADIALTPITSSLVEVETSRHESLDDLMRVMRRSDAEHVFSVAWVDLLRGGRSVLTLGSFATAEQVPDHPAGPLRRPWKQEASLPPMPPLRYAVTPGVRAFNELWFRRAPAEPTVSLESITAFFHPLDAVQNWNLVYGSTGFVQWQCVIPDTGLGGGADDPGAADDALRAICAECYRLPSYFTVLKRFGPANPAPLSFPRTGWTIAVDLPATDAVLRALPRLDAMVVDAGGRLYLAKDSRMSQATFEAGYPRLDEWRAVRARVDPNRRFASDLSERLGL